MAEGRKPVARLVAIVDVQGSDKPLWIDIGALWEVQAEGNVQYTGNMTVMPIQWADPHFPRRVAVVMRDER